MNNQNLVPNSERTPSERKELAKKAGKKSGEVRRDKKHIQASLQKLLNGKYYIGDKENKKQLGGYDALAQAIILKAISGDVQAFKEIRDTIGEKPTDKIDASINSENKDILKKYLEATKNGNFTKGN